MAGSARDEAERLVAAVLAMATGSRGDSPASPAADSGDDSPASRPAGTGGDSSGSRAAASGEDSSASRAAGTGGDSSASQAAGRGDDLSGSLAGVTAGLSVLGDSVAGIVQQFVTQGSRQSGQSGHQGSGWSTGSAECCVCPVCRVIASMRDPSPHAAERLATGAGDLAAGVASMMRAVSVLSGERPRRQTRPPSRPQTGNADETWSTATRNNPGAAWSAATNAPADASSAATGADAGDDSWSAATTVSAAAVAAERAAADAERAAARAAERAAATAARRAAAEAATARAAEAAQRVKEAVARANAAQPATDAEREEAGGGSGGRRVGPGTVTARTGGGHPRTARMPDVWAAATADAGVADVAGPPTVDHGAAGDEASGNTM